MAASGMLGERAKPGCKFCTSLAFVGSATMSEEASQFKSAPAAYGAEAAPLTLSSVAAMGNAPARNAAAP